MKREQLTDGRMKAGRARSGERAKLYESKSTDTETFANVAIADNSPCPLTPIYRKGVDKMEKKIK